ncbi:oxygenase MpaB family protein [Flexivirga meconopsidis]|uniref:oxygenase MpaB family protein n=1 Tax=Flexivirga meconopsidis TaxID=2977121 RepID=UPI00223FA2D2
MFLKTRKQLAAQFEPAADYGFFGPDSVSWKVWGHPTSYILGFARSVTIEHFDPNLAASVVQSGGVKARPHTRYARTMRYFSMVAFGATEPTAKAADILVKVHSKAIGHDPVTGGTYDANDPSSQLWIHITAWHSILYCYEKFGPGKLSAAEELQYWQECARAAELQTIDPADVPRDREAVRAYFDAWRPRLAGSEDAQDMIDFILHLDVALPPDLEKWKRASLMPVIRILSKAVVSTYPKHMRALGDVHQSALMDAAVLAPTKLIHLVLAKSLNARMLLMGMLAPDAMETGAPAVLGLPAKNPITMTPREAQAKYGYDIPAQAHLAMRAKQQERVFKQHEKPSDDGLRESEELIGQMFAHAG